jgi:excisionase family DNA binding protein
VESDTKISREEAARILGVSPERVSQLVRKGELSNVREGKFAHFDRAEVEGLLAKRDGKAESSETKKTEAPKLRPSLKLASYTADREHDAFSRALEVEIKRRRDEADREHERKLKNYERDQRKERRQGLEALQGDRELHRMREEVGHHRRDGADPRRSSFGRGTSGE